MIGLPRFPDFTSRGARPTPDSMPKPGKKVGGNGKPSQAGTDDRRRDDQRRQEQDCPSNLSICV
jgi:hypothetical protein